MPNALIGHTGFVGSHLLKHFSFDALYNSKNIEAISGQQFDTVFCAGVSAVKWLANREPAQDWLAIQRLIDALATVQVKHFVLISTVDVYPNPVGVNEDSPIDTQAQHAYGRHRYLLEEYVKHQFKQVTIVRLPGLFGEGLKKNIIFDFIHQQNYHLAHQNGRFQFYDLAHIGEDINRILAHDLPLVNITAEPVSVSQVAEASGVKNFDNKLPDPAPLYDYHSLYAHLWPASQNGYMFTAKQVLSEIHEFVTTEKAKLANG